MNLSLSFCCVCARHASHSSNPERPNIPERTGPLELPRLRALEARAAAIPISSSAASSASPRGGSSRVHPYPVGEAIVGALNGYPSYPPSGSRREYGCDAYPSNDFNPTHSFKSTSGYEPKPGSRNGLEFNPGSDRTRSRSSDGKSYLAILVRSYWRRWISGTDIHAMCSDMAVNRCWRLREH